MNTQIQIQANKKLLLQKQDQASAANSLGMLLSSMESLLLKKGYISECLFGNYDIYNAIKWKKVDDLKAQLKTHILGFKISKQSYEQKHGHFDFPDNPPISQIISIIEQWRTKTRDPEEKELCKEIIEIIRGTDSKPISYYQNQISNGSNYAPMDPNLALNMSNFAHNIIDQRNANIEREFSINPNMKINLVMNGTPGQNEYYNRYYNEVQSVNNPNKMKKQQETKLINQLKEVFDMINICSRDNNYISETQARVENFHKDLNEYFTIYSNIDFIFTKFHINNEKENLAQILNRTRNEELKIICNNMISMFSNIDQR